MDKIEELELRIRNLSLAVRLGVGVAIGAFALQCWVVMSRAPHFREIFGDLLEGTALPALTVFFMAFAMPIAIGVSVLAFLAIGCLFILPDRPWTVPLGVLVAILVIAVAQLAAFSFQLPMMQIIGSLSK